MKIYKMKKISFIIMVCFFWSCTCSVVRDEPTENIQNGNSLKSNSDSVPEYIKVDASAKINESEWKPVTGVVNVSINPDGKKNYAIMLTGDGITVALTYNGKEQTGKYKTGEGFNASVLDAKSAVHNCNEGYIQFSEFDTTKKVMSGKFGITCMGNKASGNGYNIQEASFNNLK